MRPFPNPLSGLLDNAPAQGRDFRNLRHTSLVSGGRVTVNALDNETFDMTAAVAQFVDNSNPLAPTFKVVEFDAIVGQAKAGDPGSKVILNSNGTVTTELFAGNDTAEQRRDRIAIAVIRSDLITSDIIDVITEISSISIGPFQQFRDLSAAVGKIKFSGLECRANGTDLKLKRQAGVEYTPFFSNYHVNKKDPSGQALPELTAIEFFRIYRDGAGGSTVETFTDVVNPAFWDDGTGTLNTVSSGSWSIQRLYEAGAGSFVVTYGQEEFSNFNNAIEGLIYEDPVISQFVVETSLRGYIVLRGNATDLSDSNRAVFIDPFTQYVSTRMT